MIERNLSVLLGVTLCLLLTAAHLQAADVRISWTAPTENADGTRLTDLAGYKVYLRTSGGNYMDPFNAGNTTSYTLTGLTAGQRYDVVVTAYDTSGNESAYSSPPLSFVAPTDSTPPPPAPPPPPSPPSTSVVWAVNAGGTTYQASDGTRYGADSRYSGGRSYRTSRRIAGTTDDALYQSERYGNFSYSVPLTNGDYAVTLRFAEIYFTTTGRRVFNVTIEGQRVISNLDLVARVGPYRAYDVTVPVRLRDGRLNISFQSVVNNAKVNAIQVRSGAPQGSSSTLVSGNTLSMPQSRQSQSLFTYRLPGDQSEGTHAIAASPDGGASDARVSRVVNVESLTADRLETAEVTVDHQWRRVEFKKPFADPVVIAKALSYQEASPAVVQIRGVDATGFEVRLRSWHDTDETRRPETVGYLVLKRGRYTLLDGTTIEADTVEVDRQYDAVSFAFSQPFRATPVIMTAVSSAMGDEAVTGRPNHITRQGFQFHLEPRVIDAPAETTEMISYVAWEPSSGTIDGLAFEVGRTLDVRRDQFHTLMLSEIFTDVPVFLADVQATHAGHPLNIRWGAKDPSGIEVKIDEAASSDGVEPMATDTVGYIVIQ